MKNGAEIAVHYIHVRPMEENIFKYQRIRLDSSPDNVQ